MKMTIPSIPILPILLILATLAGCSSDEGDNSNGPGGEPAELLSSSSAGTDNNSSSSSVSQNNSSSSTGGNKEPCGNTVTDNGTVSCGGQTYRTVQIGNQTWMAENLNYDVDGSKCYSNSESNCNTYGKLYDWATAMDLDASCNSSACASSVQTKHRGICPSGWHIPTNAEWDALYRYADGTSGTESPYNSSTAGKHLKATNGWNGNGNGLDTHDFAALPGGGGSSNGVFASAGRGGSWWSSSEYIASGAYQHTMSYLIDAAGWYTNYKINLFSVRCMKD